MKDAIVNVVVTKEALMKVAEDVVDLVMKKNADYKDAWQRYGVFTPLIRLNDKLLRVQTLSSGQQAMVADESISDTVVDIIGYGLLLSLRLKFEAAGAKQVHVQEPLFDIGNVISAITPTDEAKRR